MPDVQSLIESAEARGLSLFLADGKVKVRAPQALDGDAKAILQELREHKEEVESFLNEEDPTLTPDQWYPEFHRFHVQVVQETPNLDWQWLREQRPDLYMAIRAKENELDALGDARLSEVMTILREWWELILKGEFERVGASRVQPDQGNPNLERERK